MTRTGLDRRPGAAQRVRLAWRARRAQRATPLRRGSRAVVALGVAVVMLTRLGGIAFADDDAAEAPDDCIASYCAADAVYQFGPAAGFAASLFDGPTRFASVLRLGDFGLGATSPLEGEVVILDGTAYHASPTGELEILSPDTRTPFVFVKHFHADRKVELPEVDSFDSLARALDATIGSPNLFWAARIDGTFDFLRLRSVPLQERPYKTLAEVVREQNVFEATQIAGTLVGFRFPGYLGGVNAGGWHFHFVDEARRLGGHVLDVRAGELPAALDVSRVLTLALPDDAVFDAADFDRTDVSQAFRAAIRPPQSPEPAPAGAAAGKDGGAAASAAATGDVPPAATTPGDERAPAAGAPVAPASQPAATPLVLPAGSVSPLPAASPLPTTSAVPVATPATAALPAATPEATRAATASPPPTPSPRRISFPSIAVDGAPR